jgi:hypothetical protein
MEPAMQPSREQQAQSLYQSIGLPTQSPTPQQTGPLATLAQSMMPLPSQPHRPASQMTQFEIAREMLRARRGQR